MTVENVIMVLTLVASGVALLFSLKKQKHDEANLDADTIKKLYESLKEENSRYTELKAEFEAYKKQTSAQITEIAAENVKLRTWARKLCNQLESAGLTPMRYEDL